MTGDASARVMPCTLRDRLTQAAKGEGVVFGRLQQHVAVLVVTQFMAALTDDHGEPLLLVKGGTSLELRRGTPDSRTSKDLETTVRKDEERPSRVRFRFVRRRQRSPALPPHEHEWHPFQVTT